MTVRYFWTVEFVCDTVDEYADTLMRLPLGDKDDKNWQLDVDDRDGLRLVIKGYQEQ